MIREAKIVPPTSQNQRRIEDDLRAFLPQVLDLSNEGSGVGMRTCHSLLRPLYLLCDAFLALESSEARHMTKLAEWEPSVSSASGILARGTMRWGSWPRVACALGWGRAEVIEAERPAWRSWI